MALVPRCGTLPAHRMHRTGCTLGGGHTGQRENVKETGVSTEDTEHGGGPTCRSSTQIIIVPPTQNPQRVIPAEGSGARVGLKVIRAQPHVLVGGHRASGDSEAPNHSITCLPRGRSLSAWARDFIVPPEWRPSVRR